MSLLIPTIRGVAGAALPACHAAPIPSNCRVNINAVCMYTLLQVDHAGGTVTVSNVGHSCASFHVCARPHGGAEHAPIPDWLDVHPTSGELQPQVSFGFISQPALLLFPRKCSCSFPVNPSAATGQPSALGLFPVNPSACLELGTSVFRVSMSPPHCCSSKLSLDAVNALWQGSEYSGVTTGVLLNGQHLLTVWKATSFWLWRRLPGLLRAIARTAGEREHTGVSCTK